MALVNAYKVFISYIIDIYGAGEWSLKVDKIPPRDHETKMTKRSTDIFAVFDERRRKP